MFTRGCDNFAVLMRFFKALYRLVLGNDILRGYCIRLYGPSRTLFALRSAVQRLHGDQAVHKIDNLSGR